MVVPPFSEDTDCPFQEQKKEYERTKISNTKKTVQLLVTYLYDDSQNGLI